MNDLLAAHRHSVDNRAEIEASRICGCFYCLQTFAPTEIVAWTGLDVSDFEHPDAATSGTALCPHCGSETVLGDRCGHPLDAEFLRRMNEAWCQRTIIRKPAPRR